VAAAPSAAGLGAGVGTGVAAAVAAAGGVSAAKLKTGKVTEINPRTTSSCFMLEILLE
jgi:hypothetical protein